MVSQWPIHCIYTILDKLSHECSKHAASCLNRYADENKAETSAYQQSLSLFNICKNCKSMNYDSVQDIKDMNYYFSVGYYPGMS